VEVGGRAYKFSAGLEFKADVYLEPKPRNKFGEPVWASDSQTDNVPFRNPTNAADWQKISTIVAWTIIGIGLAIMG
jgi:hypothetical protein